MIWQIIFFCSCIGFNGNIKKKGKKRMKLKRVLAVGILLLGLVTCATKNVNKNDTREIAVVIEETKTETKVTKEFGIEPVVSPVVAAPIIMEPKIVYTTTRLNVRQAPSKDAKRISTLNSGVKIEVKEEKDGWYKIIIKGTPCYVCADYTSSEPPKESEGLVSASSFYKRGVLHWGGYRWTWYSERILPGGGLKIPGRHNDENGYVCDENDYICVASSTLEKGTVVTTPLGKLGKVYDCGCPVGTIDIYVSW